MITLKKQIRYHSNVILKAMCFAWMLASSIPLFAENMRFEHLSMTDGLSNNDVFCILQDSRGFMWFGTNDGLNKYDGYTYTVYKNNPGDPFSISGSEIQCMLEDHEGNLWIGTERNGFNRYDRDRDRFERFLPDTSALIRADALSVRAIFEDSQNRLWLGTSHGLYLFDREQNSFRNFATDSSDANSLSANIVFSIVEDNRGRIWAGTNNGLNLIDPESGQCERYFYSPENLPDQGTHLIRSLYADKRGFLWIGTYFGGLIKFDPRRQAIRQYVHHPSANSISANSVFCITGDHEEFLYLGTENGGLNVFNIYTEEFESYFFEVDDHATISSNSIYSLYLGKNGILWIGTFNGGVNFSSRHTRRIHHIAAKQGGLNNPYILSMAEDQKGNLWIGTDGGGLNFYDRKTGEFRYYLHDEDDPRSISANVVTAVFADAQDQIWAGTYRGGLDLLNPRTNQFMHFRNDPGNPRSLQSNYVLTLFESCEGDFYVGTFGGLDLFDRKKKSFLHFPTINGVLSIVEDESGNLWIGTYSGLSYIDHTSGGIINYTNNFNDPNSVAPTIPNSILEDSKKNLWIGTTEGLFRFDRAEQKFTQLPIVREQPNIFIHAIAEDNDGNLWVGGNPGIYKIENAVNLPERPKILDLGVRDGIKCLFRSRTGEIFFGGDYGLNVFYPEDIVVNEEVPPVVLTNLKIFNKDMKPGADGSPLKKQLSETTDLDLRYNQTVLTFEFAALNFIYPEKNEYAFIMEGFEKQWNEVGHRRNATYTNLNPGRYVFKVKGSNNDGIWNEEGASIRIHIIPPWWESLWAYGAYALLAGILFFMVRRVQMNRLRMKHELALEHMHAEKLEELNQLKSRFFSNITHEFRTPLTLIMGPVKQLLKGDLSESLREQYQIIMRNSEKLYQLINQLLDLSKLEAGHVVLRARETDVIALLERHLTYFSALAEIKNITLEFRVNHQPDYDGKTIPAYLDEDKFDKIMSNLLSNAVKFTSESGRITLEVNHLNGTSNADLTHEKHSGNRLQTLLRRMRRGKEKAVAESVPKTRREGVLEIKVMDTGVGIPPESLGRIFDRFYQVDESHTRGFEGSGIGLALSKELVELHSGSIRVESELGKGTVFTVAFPLGDHHLKPNQIVADPESNSASAEQLFGNEDLLDEESESEENLSSTRKKLPLLLLIEDNADLLKYLKRCLSHAYHILEAHHGEEGMELAISQIPDLIISDVMMPRMDGLELCRTLKSDERTSHIPIILLTARTSGESRIEGLGTGADDYITKPFEIDELEARIRNLIEQRHLLRLRYNGKTGLSPKEIATNSADEKFLEKVMKILEENISDADFSVDEFAREMALSRVQLYRKIRALTDQSTSEFIRVFRLNRAAQLLASNYGTVSEIAYLVGFNSSSYFYRAFNKHFGVPPSGYSGERE